MRVLYVAAAGAAIVIVAALMVFFGRYDYERGGAAVYRIDRFTGYPCQLPCHAEVLAASASTPIVRTVVVDKVVFPVASSDRFFPKLESRPLKAPAGIYADCWSQIAAGICAA